MSSNSVVTRGYGSFTDVNNIPVRGYLPATAPVTIAIVGTSFTEAQIVAGGDTIVLTLSNDTWAATLGADNAITDAFIAGFDSDQSDANGWNNVVRDSTLTFSNVTRDSDTQVTVTLPASPTYDTENDETITFTAAASTLVTSTSSVASATTIAITADVVVVADGADVAGPYPGGSAGWRGQRDRQRKQEQAQAEQDMLDMVRLAMPEIMKYLQ